MVDEYCCFWYISLYGFLTFPQNNPTQILYSLNKSYIEMNEWCKYICMCTYVHTVENNVKSCVACNSQAACVFYICILRERTKVIQLLSSLFANKFKSRHKYNHTSLKILLYATPDCRNAITTSWPNNIRKHFITFPKYM